MFKTFRQVARDEQGAAMVEYGLLVGLISVIAIATVTDLGNNVKTLFCDVNTALVGSGLAGMVNGGC
jgi:pilus assembly protein Flp/PilA